MQLPAIAKMKCLAGLFPESGNFYGRSVAFVVARCFLPRNGKTLRHSPANVQQICMQICMSLSVIIRILRSPR
jgi:hypothetical protein